MGMSGFCRVPHPAVTWVLVALACLAVTGFARAGTVSPGVQGCRALIQAPQSAAGGIPVTITDDSVAPHRGGADLAGVVLRGWGVTLGSQRRGHGGSPVSRPRGTDEKNV